MADGHVQGAPHATRRGPAPSRPPHSDPALRERRCRPRARLPDTAARPPRARSESYEPERGLLHVPRSCSTSPPPPPPPGAASHPRDPPHFARGASTAGGRRPLPLRRRAVGWHGGTASRRPGGRAWLMPGRIQRRWGGPAGSVRPARGYPAFVPVAFVKWTSLARRSRPAAHTDSAVRAVRRPVGPACGSRQFGRSPAGGDQSVLERRGWLGDCVGRIRWKSGGLTAGIDRK
jgi:hypothetical protein